MNKPSISNMEYLSAAQPLPTTTGATTQLSYTIKRSDHPNKRLAGFVIQLAGYQVGTATGVWPDGLAVLLQRVQVSIADRGSARDCVDITGASLTYFRNFRGSAIPRDTRRWLGSSGNAAQAVSATFPIFFAPEGLTENVGEQFSIPLAALGEDPTITMSFTGDGDLGTGSDFRSKSGGTADAIRVYVKPIFRVYADANEATSIPYIRQELKTLKTDWSGRDAASFSLPDNGVLLGLMAENFTQSATAQLLFNRGEVLNDVISDYWTLQYGDTNIDKFTPGIMAAINDLDMFNLSDTVAAPAAMNYQNAWYKDFLQDIPYSNAGNFNSCPDLSKASLKVIPSNLIGTTKNTRFTTWKVV